MSHWRLALLLVAFSVPRAPAHDALAVLDTCIKQLDSGLDVGYARIAARCPELAPSLQGSAWAPWLPADWNSPQSQLSARGLSELRELLARESAKAPAGRELRTQRVAAVLERLSKAEPASLGWWARFKHWLRELVTPHPHEADGWWRRLFGGAHLEEGALRVVVWAALVLVIGLAAAVIMNELRVAGLLRKRAPGVQRDVQRDARAGLTLESIDAADPVARPALLLEFIAARLAEQDRLPPARAFTVQELTRLARLRDESDRSRLTELAAVCERVRFSGRNVTPSVLAEAVARGREVLRALEGPAAAAGTA